VLRVALGVFTGTLVETSRPPVTTGPFDPNDVKLVANPGGIATFTFSDGNNATFVSLLNNGFQSTGSKAITRQVFRPPGTVCI
jgi:hypothetical protein